MSNFDVVPAIANALGDERSQPSHVESRLRLVKVYMLLNRVPEAMRLLMATRAMAERYQIEDLASSTLMAHVEEEFAEVALQQGDRAAAIAALRSARGRLARAGVVERSSSLGRRRVPFDSRLLSVSAKLLALIGQIESSPLRDPKAIQEVLEIAADFGASRADLNAQQASRSVDPAAGDLTELLRREGLLVDELIDLRGLLASQVTRPGETGDAGRDLLQARMREVIAELHTLKQRLGQSVDGASAALARFQGRPSALIPNDAAHWQWVLHPAGNTVVCVTSEGLWLARLDADVAPLRQSVATLVDSLTAAARSSPDKMPAYPVALASQVYAALFGSVAHRLPPAMHWIISPPPIFDRLPWGALVPGAASSAKRGTEWLNDRFAITVTPSLTAWIQLQDRAATRARMAFLGIGDPLGSGAVGPASLGKRGTYVASISPAAPIVVAAQSSFGRELRSAARLFPRDSSNLLKGKDATKRMLQQTDLADYRIVLFSTHGFLSGSVLRSLGPSLQLTKGSGDARDQFLSSAEIARFKLDADVVVLSACDTSASDGFVDTEGFSGLTSAFLLAGARTVVATLWPVETTSAETLTVEALGAYVRNSGQSFAYALRTAALAKAHGADGRYRHPYYWSGFIAVGR